MNIPLPSIRKYFLFIFLIELLSLAGYFFSGLNAVFFIVLSLIFLAIASRNLPVALLIVFAELFIGSKGYLFSLNFFGVAVSIRLSIFLVLMSVWLYVLAGKLIKKEISRAVVRDFISKSPVTKLVLVLCVFITIGAINAFIRQNSFDNIFFDLNGWLFFGLFFPLFSLPIFYPAASEEFIKDLGSVFLASAAWLSFKTLVLLYLFSHLGPLLFDIYSWVRQSGIGEITLMPGNFYRIFIQSQIYILAGIIIALAMEARNNSEKKNRIPFILLVLFLSATIISLSRSNWLGLALAIGIFFIGHSFFYLKTFRVWLNYWLKAFAALLLSFVLIFVLVKIPWPSIGLDVNALASLQDRAGNISGEAGAASRWALWPEIAKGIKSAPLLGRGFGATVIYQTSDPRILASNPDGLYTTYAFEWGWLDIWFKLGIFGLLVYAAIFAMVMKDAVKAVFQKKDIYSLTIVSLLILLASINFFSPYLNHPLGIGYLLIVSYYFNNHTRANSDS